jgi:hypothetical protein
VAVRDKPAHRIAIIKEQLGGQVNVFCGDALLARYLSSFFEFEPADMAAPDHAFIVIYIAADDFGQHGQIEVADFRIAFGETVKLHQIPVSGFLAELRQFLPWRKAESVISALTMSFIALLRFELFERQKLALNLYIPAGITDPSKCAFEMISEHGEFGLSRGALEGAPPCS